VAGVNVIGTVDRPPKSTKDLQTIYDAQNAETDAPLI